MNESFSIPHYSFNQKHNQLTAEGSLESQSQMPKVTCGRGFGFKAMRF